MKFIFFASVFFTAETGGASCPGFFILLLLGVGVVALFMRINNAKL